MEEELRKREGGTDSFLLFNSSDLSAELGFGGSVKEGSGDSFKQYFCIANLKGIPFKVNVIVSVSHLQSAELQKLKLKCFCYV